MTEVDDPRRRVRRTPVLALLAAFAVATSASVAGAIGKPGPEVKAAGVGTKAALESEHCGEDGLLAFPYQGRPPCTAPLAEGKSNGGATAKGVTEDSIKVVVLVGTPEQQTAERNRPGGSAPIDRATGGPGSTEQSYRDWDAVLKHSYNTFGRTIEYEFVTPSGADEAGQRADALKIADMDPFFVINAAPATAGGGQVFASELVAKKVIVLQAGATNDEATAQAPYRYLGGFDNNSSAVNGAQVLARMFVGETAKWSGDFTDDKRTFGAIHPDQGIDFEYFTDTFEEEGGKLALEPLSYPVLPDASQQTASDQELAPTIMARMKDAGVTTIVSFASFGMAQQLMPAADDLDYHPEWFFPGANAQDIEITARILNGVAPDQMEHVFGIGTLVLIAEGVTDPVVRWFDWYWGTNQGVYAPAAVGTLRFLYGGVHMGGPKLTPKTFRQGLFSVPAQGGAADNQVSSFMNGYGPSVGLPYDEHAAVGLDFALMWWNPEEKGLGKILFDEGTGKFMYPNNAKRYTVDGWKKGEPKLFDPSNSISKFTELPATEIDPPEPPCTGCPSEGGTAS
jgi:hypothetical protein